MPEFECRVGTPGGDIRLESHVAADEAALREELARRDLHVFEVRRRGAGIPLPFGLGTRAAAVPRRKFLLFNQELVTLLRAGLPVLQCLNVVLEREAPGPFRRYLQDIRDRVQAGAALSEAFLAQGEAFPRMYGASLTAGEKSGELAGVMARYVKYTKKTQAIRTRVIAALIYPTILVIMSVALVALLMFFIIPKFTEFYGEFGGQLPINTVIIIGIANWLRAHWALTLPPLGIGLVAALGWSRTEAGAAFFDRVRLSVPLLGPIVRWYNVAQFSRTLSTLLAGGIPLVSALQTATGALGNRVFRSALAEITDNVRQGRSLWESIEGTGVMTDLTVELCKVGEATGSLSAMLGDVAEFYDEQIDDALTRFVAFFEPVLLVTMGLLVANILLAMYLPIFRLAGQEAS